MLQYPAPAHDVRKTLCGPWNDVVTTSSAGWVLNTHFKVEDHFRHYIEDDKSKWVILEKSLERDKRESLENIKKKLK